MELDIEDFLVGVPVSWFDAVDFIDDDFDEFDSNFILESVLSDSELRGCSESRSSKEL
jgi:hypothetical protein